MSWKDDFKKSFDITYDFVNKKVCNLKYPCYGGRFHWFLVSRYFDSLYFYLTENSLIYTLSGAYITEIPFNTIKKISIQRGLFVKSSIHIRIVADKKVGNAHSKLLAYRSFSCVQTMQNGEVDSSNYKKYHLLLKDMKWLSTRKTGHNEDNIKGFIATLQASVEKIRVTE